MHFAGSHTEADWYNSHCHKRQNDGYDYTSFGFFGWRIHISKPKNGHDDGIFARRCLYGVIRRQCIVWSAWTAKGRDIVFEISPRLACLELQHLPRRCRFCDVRKDCTGHPKRWHNGFVMSQAMALPRGVAKALWLDPRTPFHHSAHPWSLPPSPLHDRQARYHPYSVVWREATALLLCRKLLTLNIILA
jgi:hypothetical protein